MIRNATMADIPHIHSLLNGFAEQGVMLGRSKNSLYDKIRDFVVFEENGEVLGVCALQISWENLAEIRSLAVAAGAHGRGVGRALVESCLAEAKEFKITKIFTLTYQDEFFRRLGFVDIDKKDLPHKIWSDCLHCPKFPDCDENALLLTQPLDMA